MSINIPAAVGNYGVIRGAGAQFSGDGRRGSIGLATADFHGAVPAGLKSGIEAGNLRMGGWFCPGATDLGAFNAFLSVGNAAANDSQHVLYTTNTSKMASQTQTAGVTQGPIHQPAMELGIWYHFEYQTWESPAGTGHFHLVCTREDGTEIIRAGGTDSTGLAWPVVTQFDVGNMAELTHSNQLKGSYVAEVYIDDNPDNGAFALHDWICNGGDRRYLEDSLSPPDFWWKLDYTTPVNVSAGDAQLTNQGSGGTFTLNTLTGTPVGRQECPPGGTQLNRDDYGVSFWVRPTTGYAAGTGSTADTRVGWEGTRGNFSDTVRLTNDATGSEYEATMGAEIDKWAFSGKPTIPVDTWTHVFIWFHTDSPRASSGYQYDLYINGTSLGTATTAAVTPRDFIAEFSHHYFGNVGSGAVWGGKMAEFALISGTEPTADQITQMAAGIAPNLIFVAPQLLYYNTMRDASALTSPKVGTGVIDLVGSATADAAENPEIVYAFGTGGNTGARQMLLESAQGRRGWR